MAPQVFWDVRSEADHDEMAQLLALLVAASRDRNFIDRAAVRAQTYAWRLTLAEVPKPIVAAAIERIVARGVTWMPKPGEVKKECAAVVEDKRRALRTQFLSACEHSSQWVDGDRGVERCPCWKGLQTALAHVERPITLPLTEKALGDEFEKTFRPAYSKHVALKAV